MLFTGGSMLLVLLCHLISSSVTFASTSPSPKDDRLTLTNVVLSQAAVGQRSSLDARFIEQETQAACGPCIGPSSNDQPFKFFRIKKTWSQARRACVMNGGHLAIIRSVENELAVRNVLEREDLQEAWLGFHARFEENEWLSVLDEQLDSFCYVHWLPKEPQQYYDTCVSYLTSGIQSQGCTNMLPYFCEYTTCSASANA